MNESDRDKFYKSGTPTPSAPSPPDDDSGEYELEPLDPSVVEADERRGREVQEAARSAIDIDEIYREADRDVASEILGNWFKNFRFQFQTKHLLIATALLAVVLAVAKLGMFWPSLMIFVMLSIAGLYSYLKWEESKHQAEVDRKLQELYARRREKLKARGVVGSGGDPIRTDDSAADEVFTTGDRPNDVWQEETKREPFRFQFSMKTLIITFTAAAVALGLISIFGGPSEMASILGFLAVVGLTIHAFGYEPPPVVILGWWGLMALYVLLTILGAIWSAFA